MVSIGVDIGGSHISSVAVKSNTGDFIEDSYHQSRLQNTAGALSMLSTWCSTIKKSMDAVSGMKVTGMGIAMPGPFDYKNGISVIRGIGKFNQLMGLDIRTALRSHLNLAENFPIHFINDAFAFGIGEAWQGVGKNKSRVVAITLGTGFGAAFLHEGVPVVKNHAVPKHGYIYHVPYKDSIADEYISTRWFLAEYKKILKKEIPGVKELALEAKNIPAVAEIFKEYGENLANILSPWLKRFESDLLVIGGNIAGAGEWFLPSFLKVLKERQVLIPVKISVLKEKAALKGCGRLGDPLFYKKVEINLY